MLQIKKPCLLIVLAVTVVTFNHLLARAQTRENNCRTIVGDKAHTNRQLTNHRYYELLAILMPTAVIVDQEIETVITIRVEPSFTEESQYLLLKKKNGGAEIIKKVSVKGNIYYQISKLEEAADDFIPFEQFLANIKVEEKCTTISEQTFKSLFESLKLALLKTEAIRKKEILEAERLRKQGKFMFAADGTSYVLWIAGEGQHSELNLHGNGLGGKPKGDKYPVINWIRKMQKEVEL